MDPKPVVVVDFEMSFGSMVKWALAAIPAFLILTMVVAAAFRLLMLMTGGDSAPTTTI